MSFTTKAVVTDQNGALFYRQEHEWADLSPEMQKALEVGLEKQAKFLDDLKAQQHKTPDAVYSAVLTATGQPDLTYEEFTYDSFQKAYHAWHQMLETFLRLGEKHIKQKP